MESTTGTTEAFIREAIKLGWAVPVSELERFGISLPADYYIDSGNIARHGAEWTGATEEPTGCPPPVSRHQPMLDKLACELHEEAEREGNQELLKSLRKHLPLPTNPRHESPAQQHAGKIFAAIVVLAVVGCWAYRKVQDSKTTNHRAEQRAAQEQQSSKALSEAQARYGAIADWDEKFRNSISDPFTVQLQDALIPKNGKPIVARGFLEDVTQHDGTYYLHLNALDSGSFTVSFVLECESATADKVLQKQTSMDEVCIIAQISSVEKAALALRSGEKTTEELAPIETDSSSLFIAQGKCLAIIFNDE